jgi:hypothetical protein
MYGSRFFSSNVLIAASLLVLIPARCDEVTRHVSTQSALSNERENRALNTNLQFYDSGDEFFRLCSAVTRIERGSQIARDISDAKACESYVAGLADGTELQHTWSRSHGDQSKAAFCVQLENAPTPRLVSAVLQYLREHPDRRRFRAAIAVEEVLHKMYPCR